MCGVTMEVFRRRRKSKARKLAEPTKADGLSLCGHDDNLLVDLNVVLVAKNTREHDFSTVTHSIHLARRTTFTMNGTTSTLTEPRNKAHLQFDTLQSDQRYLLLSKSTTHCPKNGA